MCKYKYDFPSSQCQAKPLVSFSHNLFKSERASEREKERKMKRSSSSSFPPSYSKIFFEIVPKASFAAAATTALLLQLYMPKCITEAVSSSS